MKKKSKDVSIKIAIGFIVLILVLLIFLNPSRGSFNHVVFDGGRPNSITGDQEIMQNIIEINRQCYRNENDPRVKRQNYVIYSIYEVQVSSNQVIHVLGIGGMFRLLNS